MSLRLCIETLSCLFFVLLSGEIRSHVVKRYLEKTKLYISNISSKKDAREYTNSCLFFKPFL